MARPFQEATTLSSRAGCGRWSRAASSRAADVLPAVDHGRVGGVDVAGQHAARCCRARTCPAVVTPNRSAAQAPSSSPSTSIELGRASTRRSGPRPRRCRRPARRQARRPGCPGRAAGTAAVSSAIRRGERVAGQPPQLGVDPQQQRVVVQHLLEVRHGPACRPPRSGRSRRPAGRRCRRGPSARRCAGRSPATRAAPVRWWWRSRNSRFMCGGNFGAPPNPPYRRS